MRWNKRQDQSWALQVPRCTKGAHPIQWYWQIQREISFNLVFWTYQLAQGIKRYDHFRLANWHQSYIIDIIISQSAAAIVTHCQRTEASVSHLHQTLWGRNADSGNFYYTIFQDPGPIENFYTWNCSQFHTDYEIIIRSDGHLLYTQEPAVWGDDVWCFQVPKMHFFCLILISSKF